MLTLQVILPIPVRHHFDYLPCLDITKEKLQPGVRVLVPFGKNKRCIGILVGISDERQKSGYKLKKIFKILDDKPLINKEQLKLMKWASEYYLHPLGEIVFTALPKFLRQGKKANQSSSSIWKLTECGRQFEADKIKRFSKQKKILELLAKNLDGMSTIELSKIFARWKPSMKSLQENGLVDQVLNQASPVTGDGSNASGIHFSGEQKDAIDTIMPLLGTNSRILLDGITGSGKTEIYLELVKAVIHQGLQALILIPEIGLTPQFITHIKQRIQTSIVILHSSMSDGERLQGWVDAGEGRVSVILGTRSAVWTPMARPGIFIIDEEHDTSYKQNDGFRYSARDIAIMRGKNLSVPVILGSATPSIESLYNASINKYKRITLTERVGTAFLPKIQIVDLRRQKMTGALSGILLKSIEHELAKRKQILLFLNRRGYSPILMCHSCGWILSCERCAIPMTYHKHKNRMLCHHCGASSLPSNKCVNCQEADLIHIGHGTERITETLSEVFPNARILRIDRDTTRRRGAMNDMVDRIKTGKADILVGTQMLAKGHHFPDVTLVGIIDTDRGLFSSDFRAGERMGQLLVQVSGRAGRSTSPGNVLIQTHFPDHPLLTTLINQNYASFADYLIDERKATRLPPFSHMAMLRAEGYDEKLPMMFLSEACELLKRDTHGIEVNGPYPAPIEKRLGRYRFQLTIQSPNRVLIQKMLRPRIQVLDTLKSGKKIRWSLDIDPQEML